MDDVARGVGSFFGWFDATSDTEPGSLLWSADPHVQLVILAILVLAAASFAFILAPFSWRLIRVGRLQRDVTAVLDSDEPVRLPALRGRVDDAFLRSPIALQWEVFLGRWRSSVVSDGKDDRAPVRLADVLEESPILPTGARKSLLAALPGLFLASGTLGALVAIALAIPSAAQIENLQADLQMSELASSIEMALRTALWGLLLSMVSALASRWLEGRADWRSEQLDALVSRVYAFAPAVDSQAPRAGAGELGTLRGEFAQMLDSRFAVQASAMRSLRDQLADVSARPASAAAASTGGAPELSEAAALLRRATSQLDGAARDVDAKLDALRLVSGALDQAASRAGGDQEARDGANELLRTLGDSLREAVGEVRQALASGSGGAPRIDGADETLRELHEVASGLRETLAQTSPAEQNAAAQRGLIEEELGRLADVLDQRLTPVDDRLQQLQGAVAGAVADREAQGKSSRAELESAMERLLAGVGDRMERLQTRLDRLESKLGSGGAGRDEEARAALQQQIDATLERFAESIHQRFEQLGAELAAAASSEGDPSAEAEAQRAFIEESFVRVANSLGERLDPLDQRLQSLSADLSALSGSSSEASQAHSVLEGVATDLRAVAADFGKALEPTHGLREVAGDLARQLEQTLSRLGEWVAAEGRAVADGEHEAEARSEHARNVQRALERARAVAASGSEPSPAEAQTRIITQVDVPVPEPDAADTVPQARPAPKQEPTAISEPEGKRPPGLSSLLSKRPRRGGDR